MAPFTLADLATQTGVTPRTVRYYIAQGLLPAPAEQGRGAHYSDGHLARIRLIKRLQREHLPLAEIRTRLRALDDGDVMRALDDAEASAGGRAPEPGSALEYVRRVLDERGSAPARASRLLRAVPPSVAPFSSGPRDAASWPASQRGIAPDRDTHAAFLREAPDAFPLRDDPGHPPRELHSTPPLPGSFPTPGPRPGERSTWERIAVTPDIELHVRRPLDRHGNRMLDRLLAHARELLRDP